MTDDNKQIKICSAGGWASKIAPKVLEDALKNIPQTNHKDDKLLVGFDTNDDCAVYKVSDKEAIVETIDFFPSMINDPYVFGQIAAANALSDIFAMGAKAVLALNMVCFPSDMDGKILGEILRGGQEKIEEAGAILCGGHSISDDTVKYGLAVTGIVDIDKILKNNSGNVGDLLILTKPLGVGILVTANNNDIIKDNRNVVFVYLYISPFWQYSISFLFNTNSILNKY